MNDYRPFWRDTGHSPSILLATENCQRIFDFKQWLKAEGCQVHEVNINQVDGLMVLCRSIMFDVMVLNIKTCEERPFEERYKMLRRLRKNLKAVPALLTLPMVVISACDQVEATVERLAPRPVYWISRDSSTRLRLLQTIERIHLLNLPIGETGLAPHTKLRIKNLMKPSFNPQRELDYEQ